MKIAVVGGGAAGFFAAINIKEKCRDAEVVILEKSSSPLAKVAITGGGRCNVTNSFDRVKSFTDVYPRGDKLMQRGFRTFSNRDAVEWFEGHGVMLTKQDDERFFPKSQQAQEIINMFLARCKALGIEIVCNCKVCGIRRAGGTSADDEGFVIECEHTKFSAHKGGKDRARDTFLADRVVFAVGGCSQKTHDGIFAELPVKTVPTVPSLFSFNIPDKEVIALMGTVIEGATVKMQGTKIRSNGALLFTHWGMSGPAILLLSSYAAVLMSERNYKVTISVNWLGEKTESEVLGDINEVIITQGNRQLSSVRIGGLPSRLWDFLLHKIEADGTKRWNEIGKKVINKLVNVITNDEYTIDGKSRFKDEFVTCGGVSLKDVSGSTLESKKHRGLYFAGEALDIDAVTGGFNLQAAWTTAYLVATDITKGA